MSTVLFNKAKPQSWSQFQDRFDVRFADKEEAQDFWDEVAPYSHFTDIIGYSAGYILWFSTDNPETVLCLLRKRRN